MVASEHLTTEDARQLIKDFVREQLEGLVGLELLAEVLYEFLIKVGIDELVQRVYNRGWLDQKS